MPHDHGLTVAGMSAATGVSPHTLRYYERAGLIHPVARTPGNRRRDVDSDVEWVMFLLRLRETGMPIAQMREYALLRAQGGSTIGSRLNMLQTHHEALRTQIARLRRHEKALAAKVTVYRNDLKASGHHNLAGATDE